MKVETREYDGKTFKSVQITRLDTKGKILDIQDTISYIKDGEFEPFEKVVLNCTEYGTGKESVNVKHYMDLDDFLVLCWDIINKREVGFEDFKGSKSSKYKTGYEARVLKVASWPQGDNGNGAYTVTFESGPGVAGDKGQVSMEKGADITQVKMILKIPEARRAFLYAYNYVNNKQTAFLSKQYDSLFK